MPSSPPTICPECGRELVAPLFHAVCSDCGFEYDEHTLVWHPRHPRRLYWLIANVLVCSPVLFHFLQVLLLYRQRPSNALSVGALIALAGLLWAVPRLASFFAEGERYVAVTPRGIQARTSHESFMLEWEEFDGVRVRFGVPRVCRRSGARASALEWVFDTDQEVRAFEEAVATARQRYAPAPPAEPSV